jgi:hypothetical protein
MNVTAITKNGRDVFRVYLGVVEGKKRYKQFKTEPDATTWVENEVARQQAHGRITAGLDGSLVAAWAELDKKLRGFGISLKQCAQQTIDRLKAVEINGSPEECLDAFIRYGIREELRPAYLSDLRSRCLRFIKSLPPGTTAKDIVQEHVRLHLSNLPGGLIQRKNQRRNLGAWLRWATEEGWLGEDPMPPTNRRKKKKENCGSNAVILSPAQTSALLTAAIQSNALTVLPYLFLSLFAGVRPAEFRKRIYDKNGKRKTVCLQWENITQDGIDLSAQSSKTGEPRLIPLNDTIKAWIECQFAFTRVNSGPILPSNWREAWDEWRANHWLDEKGSPIPWHPDQLRHSYGTYRLATCKNPEEVALEMGNSSAVVKRHYWKYNTRVEDADAYWSMTPVQCFQWQKPEKPKGKSTSSFFAR